MGKPCAHLAGTADDQHALACAAGPGRHASLLLVRQRCANQYFHDLLGELRLEPVSTSLLVRAFQHFALPLIIPRRNGVLDLVSRDLGDDFLTGGNETDQLAIDLGESFT